MAGHSVISQTLARLFTRASAQKVIPTMDVRLVRVRRTDCLYQHAWITLAASVLVAAVVAVVVGPEMGQVRQLTWVLAIAAIGLIRVVLITRYGRTRDNADFDPLPWLFRSRVVTFASGCVWGLGILALAPRLDSLTQTFMLLCGGGLTAGAVASYTSDVKSFNAFTGPIVALATLRYLPQPTSVAGGSAAVFLIFWALMFLYIRRLNGAMLQSLAFEFTNQVLMRKLDAQHRQLEERVAERTLALDQTNRQLQAEIDHSRQLAESLSYQATHDALTGLINRAEFERRLTQALATARDHDSHHVLCYLDLDQFKIVNDSCGHCAGDELLRQLSMLIKAEIRSRDTLARLGGDEFGILMEHCTLEQGQARAESLYHTLRGFKFCWEDRVFTVGVSMGMISLDAKSGDLHDVLKRADVACYEAKDQGRNRVHVIDHPSNLVVTRRHGEIHWAAQVERAQVENNFRLYYQTIEPISLQSSHGLHYEVLLRLRDEHRGIVEPAVFMPPAERFNLAPKIDRWVVRQVLSWLAQRPAHLQALDVCAINLSGASLGDAKFLEFLVDSVHKGGVPGEKLCFEITETAAISNLHRATQLIDELHGLGCQFALDDFGSGLSSFSYLRALPVDYLKIDGTFVHDIAEDSIAFAMVRSINEIGQLLGKKTVAEYVINDAVKEKLQAIGVDYGQGFGISYPQPISALPQ